MWDRQCRGSRRCELHSRKASCESDGHLCNGQPIVVRDNVCMSTPDTLSASTIGTTNAVCLLGCTPRSSPLSHQVASYKGAGILTLGYLRPRCEWNLRTRFEEDLEASCAKGFLVYEASVVY